MSKAASKRSTVYFDLELHKAVRLKAMRTHRPISDIINEAVRQFLHEDLEDLAVFEARGAESLMSHEALLINLKAHDKL